jgi:hypothetical protein
LTARLFEKPFVFITGAPRSGTSLLTKIIDAHPDAAILMEHIFGNRRRHWQRPGFWDSPESLAREVEKAYAGIPEPIIGNKVATPDVWDAGDITRFCRLFEDFKMIFVVRDPAAVALSRHRREPEDFAKVFSAEARKHILIDFRSRYHAYVSSWRQSVENYWKLKDGFRDRVMLVYYEDLCGDFEASARDVFVFLGIPFASQVLAWHEMPHHDASGALVRDLKYPDAPVESPKEVGEIPDELQNALALIPFQYSLWRQRKL